MPRESTFLGECAVSPSVIEVVQAARANWLVRTRYLDAVPTNHMSFESPHLANAFASELAEMTADMATRLVGFPAKIELAEVPDASKN